MPAASDPLLAAGLVARLARVQAELDATKSQLAASLLREATLRAPGVHRAKPPVPRDVVITVGGKKIDVHPGGVVKLTNVTPEQVVVHNPPPRNPKSRFNFFR